MALVTLGTNATTTLSAFNWSRNPGHPQDVGTLRALILNDLSSGLGATSTSVGVGKAIPGNFEQGLLVIPNRGVLQLLPGDFVGVDATGWPILVSAAAIASGITSWTHT